MLTLAQQITGPHMCGRFGCRHFVGRGPWWPLGGLLWLALLAGLVTLFVYLVLRIFRPTHAHHHMSSVPTGSPWAPGGPGGPDAAMAALRMRYANGQLSREEYLQAAADLGHPPPF